MVPTLQWMFLKIKTMNWIPFSLYYVNTHAQSHCVVRYTFYKFPFVKMKDNFVWTQSMALNNELFTSVIKQRRLYKRATKNLSVSAICIIFHCSHNVVDVADLNLFHLFAVCFRLVRFCPTFDSEHIWSAQTHEPHDFLITRSAPFSKTSCTPSPSNKMYQIWCFGGRKCLFLCWS